mgnify:CR=1 FL=1
MTYDASPTHAPPRTGLAVTSLVLGILSFVSLGPLAGIPAIVTGVMAGKRAKREPTVYGGKGMATAGVVLGTVNLVMIAALIALLLPALAAARDAAKQTVATSNVRQILLATHAYALEHRSHLPAHLAAILPYAPAGQLFTDPATTTVPMILTQADLKGDWRALAATLEAHCDFYYVGAGLNLTRIPDPRQIMLVYSKDVRKNRLRVVGFADGHAAAIGPADFGSLFARLNQLRETQGLAPVALDEHATESAEQP